MDKILLGAYLSVLAGFLTAVISVVKLVNEKESKTTDYRQEWTKSVRLSLSDLISNLNLHASNILLRYRDGVKMNELAQKPNKTDEDKTLESYLKQRLLDCDSAIQENKQKIQQAYALTRLHFKQNDLSFSRVEQKYDIIISMLYSESQNLIGQDNGAELAVLVEKTYARVSELAGFSRDILKTEWETVKLGEKSYQRTKNWAIWGGAFLLLTLIISGIYIIFTIKMTTSLDDSLSTSLKAESSEKHVEYTTSNEDKFNTACPISNNTQNVTIENGAVSQSKTTKPLLRQKTSAHLASSCGINP